MKRPLVQWVFAAILCFSVGCSRDRAPNILLIVVDTLRADRVGAYGNQRGLTPFIDALAARGYVFRHAYAQSSWTNPSVASILTSRFQSQHGITTFESVLAETEVTLPEVLKQHGYATGFFSANGLIGHRLGFAQGYDEFWSILVEATNAPEYMWVPERATRINEVALAWLDNLSPPPGPSRPVFLHLHYMEPHNPYAPRDEALEHIADGGPPPNVERANSTSFYGYSLPLKPEALRNLQNVYDAAVLSLDMELRSMFVELERRRFFDNALIVFTSDHGDEFKEHGFLGHEKTLFQEVVHVPLILVVPGQTERIEVEPVVSLVDVAPTLVDFVGGTVPPSFEGQSWKGTLVREPSRWRFLSRGRTPLDEEPASAGTAYTELIKMPEGKRYTPHEHAVVSGSRKLIVGHDGEREYYDLSGDPSEMNPHALTEAERLDLQGTYERFRARTIEHAAPRSTRTLDEDTKERIRALGYRP